MAKSEGKQQDLTSFTTWLKERPLWLHFPLSWSLSLAGRTPTPFHCQDTAGEGLWEPLRPCWECGRHRPGPALRVAPFLLQYIFADAYAQYLWITFDFCNTIQGFSIPFRAADLLLHSKASNLLLGFDRSHPNKQVRELLGHSQVGHLVACLSFG